MAPDLNSVPKSPRSLLGTSNSPDAAHGTAPRQPSRQNSSSGVPQLTPTSASRRASQIFPMSPPPLPLASPSAGTAQADAPRPSSQSHQAFPPVSSGASASAEGTSLPMRHPRPLTAAELHLELEKEQEAVVNRLTRELNALRAHSESVTSTASTASSAAAPAPADGPTSRRHRSSSSMSRGSFSYAIPLTPATSTIPHYHRQSLSRTHTQDSSGAGGANEIPGSQGMTRTVSTQRFEEAAHARRELEDAKWENDALRQRVRELEAIIRRRGREGEGAATGQE